MTTHTDPTLEWSIAILSLTPTRFTNLVNALPLELLTMPPAPNEWSAMECLQHLIDVERISTHQRIDALMTGKPIPGFDPAEQGTKTPATSGLPAEFQVLRTQTLEMLRDVTPADLDRQALHAEYGMVTLREFLNHIATHDLNHTVQAERALMQPFIKGLGPWRENYLDHIVE
jgi:uncharacterized damage-inducible protein DinB